MNIQQYLTERTRITDEFYGSAGAVSCHRGCSNCCYQMVAVTFADAWVLAAYVLALPAEERKGLLEAMERDYSIQAHEDHVSWLEYKRPCPFLASDGTCGVYGIRPVNCRQVLSRASPDYCAPDNLVALAKDLPTAGRPVIVPWNQMEPLAEMAQECMRPVLGLYGIDVDLTTAPLPMAVLACVYTMVTGDAGALRSWAASTRPMPQHRPTTDRTVCSQTTQAT